MATYDLQRQRGNVETTIKTVINSDLKEICKAYHYQVSGTKAVLQKRCIEILDTLVKSGDVEGFRAFQYRVNHHGQAPPRTLATTASSSNYQNGNYGTDYMAPGQGRSMLSNSRIPPMGNRLNFKSSPFYEVLDTVLPLQDLAAGLEMPQNRNTVRATITLNADQVARLTSDPNMKLLMYCGVSSTPAYTPVDIAFPNQLEVKVNGDDVKWNFKGLKNKPGSTKPADLSDRVRRKAGYPNQLSVTYALTQKRFAFTVHLVKYISAHTLTQRIKEGKHGGGIITKQKVLEEMQSTVDDDLGVTSVRMSLKDPISTLRITLPVRSTVCKHTQCFDGSMFMQLQDQAPQWSCPVCNKSVNYEQLCIDKFFEEILQKTPSSIEKVDMEPDGRWQVIKEEGDESQANGNGAKPGRAAYDDDFDDEEDLVDVTESQIKAQPKSGVPLPTRPTPSALSPMPNAGVAMNTPPMSSRGPSAAPSASSAARSNKRPASAVIDLTLSDDDEPPRSARRTTTNTSTRPNTSTSTYSTPNSLPDPRYPSYPPGQPRVSDSFRPSSNSSRPPSIGPSNGPFNHYSNNNGFGGSSFGRLSAESPVQPGNSASAWQLPGGQNNGNNIQPAWRSTAGANSGTPSTFPQFSAMRQPSMSAATHPGSSSSPAQQTSRPLPPMRDHPPGPYSSGTSGWRSNSYSGYSHSPPG